MPRQRLHLLTGTYEGWMKKEGIPVYEELAGIEDITELPRRPWARMGGLGTFIELGGTRQEGKLMYLAEIPGGGSLEPERHLYDELLYIIQGRGLAEVWQQGTAKRTFEWGEGSLFAIPLNAWHRLVNGSREPALVFGVTSAPVIMEALRNTEFIFNCDYDFSDRYSGKADYFAAGEKRWSERYTNVWETNFVPDVRTALLDDLFVKVEGGQVTNFRMASWTTVHASEWPAGKYHKAHYHGPGAVILGLSGEGYALVWPRQCGIHPFQDGFGDKVLKVEWKRNGIYSPLNEWFHQHFNTGKDSSRQLRVTGGGTRFGGPLFEEGITQPQMISVREGGSLIDYQDEDPEIRRMFEKALREKGVKSTMSPVTYRTDPFRFY